MERLKSYGKQCERFKIGKENDMKTKIYLQLFAEDPAQADPKPADPKPADPKAKYTDDDLDKIINQKFAEWQKKQQKAVDEAKKLAEMNAQQKAEYERDQLQKRIEEYEKKESLSEMKKTARDMLKESNISVSDELLSMMVSTDAEETKAAVDGFAKAFKEAVEEAVKERLKGTPPKVGTKGAPAMTKEQIMDIKDPELRQKKMLENRELFNF